MAPDVGVKDAIVGILWHILVDAEETVQGCASTVLQDIVALGLDRLPRPYPLPSHLPLHAAYPLLDQVLENLFMEHDLHRLKNMRLLGHKPTLYIAPQAKASGDASDKDSFSLMGKVMDFLESSDEVFLIAGDSGSEKTTFNRRLERTLWKSYQPGDRIPLLINLPELSDAERELISSISG